MFDFTHTEPARETLDLARTIFLDHGHDLANAARHLGGEAGESRVRSCALQLEAATRMNPRIRRDLVVIHRLVESFTNGFSITQFSFRFQNFALRLSLLQRRELTCFSEFECK